MSPTVGSLFTGIGGIDLGLQRAGFEITWQVETDDYASRVLAKHWPAVARHRDVRHVGAGNLAPVDLVTGGFPCQDVSNAGKRAGIEGEQSGLWSEFARVVSELRPHYVLVENVTALLGRGFSRVLGDLAALGYDAEWEVISAADIGAPHLRERVFIVAYPEGDGCRPGRPGRPNSGSEGEPEPVRPLQNAVPHSFGDGLERIFQTGTEAGTTLGGGGDWWALEPNVGRVAPRTSTTVDRLRGLGNAVVPQVAEYIGTQLMRHLRAEETS